MSNGEIRVSHEEREAAKRLLHEHFEAGRLDADEYEDRRGRAGDAITRTDLDALFADLPAADDARHHLPARSEQGALTPGVTEKDPWAARKGALSGIIALGALALFFATGRWQWFLLIPLVALLWTFFTGRDD